MALLTGTNDPEQALLPAETTAAPSVAPAVAATPAPMPATTPAAAPAPIDAPTAPAFDESKGVAGRVNSIIQEDSPLMQTAATRAAEAMNARGLRNSSTAIQAGQQAVIEAATPIAAQDATLSQNQGQFNAGLLNQRVLAKMDADSRERLADTEAKFKTQIAGDQNISDTWNKTMTQIGVIQANPDLTPETKQAQINGVLASFKAFAGFWSQASGRDVSALLDFGALGSGAATGTAPATGSTAGASGAGGGTPIAAAVAAAYGGSSSSGATGGGSGPNGAVQYGDAEGGGVGGSSATPANAGFTTGLTNTQASLAGALFGQGATAAAANQFINWLGSVFKTPGTGGAAATAGATAAEAATKAGATPEAAAAAGQAAANAVMAGATPQAAASAGQSAASGAGGSTSGSGAPSLPGMNYQTGPGGWGYYPSSGGSSTTTPSTYGTSEGE